VGRRDRQLSRRIATEESSKKVDRGARQPAARALMLLSRVSNSSRRSCRLSLPIVEAVQIF
jgi:hypothetical protein